MKYDRVGSIAFTACAFMSGSRSLVNGPKVKQLDAWMESWAMVVANASELPMAEKLTTQDSLPIIIRNARNDWKHVDQIWEHGVSGRDTMAVKLQIVPKLGVSLKVSCMRTREIHVVEVDRPND